MDAASPFMPDVGSNPHVPEDTGFEFDQRPRWVAADLAFSRRYADSARAGDSDLGLSRWVVLPRALPALVGSGGVSNSGADLSYASGPLYPCPSRSSDRSRATGAWIRTPAIRIAMTLPGTETHVDERGDSRAVHHADASCGSGMRRAARAARSFVREWQSAIDARIRSLRSGGAPTAR
jgi:hypothetical protein